MRTHPPPILILDTSVFVRHALSSRAEAGAAGVVLNFALHAAHVVISAEIEREVHAKLAERGYDEAAILARYGAILRRAHRVTPAAERDDHRRAVNGDAGDTMLVRTAEVASDQLADIWTADQLHLLVSENTRHLRPNHWFAGFEFVTCSAALHRIRAEIRKT